METRRSFLKKAASASALLMAARCSGGAAERRVATAASVLPWYRRALRWGQTNITEADPARYDVEWWRGYWKRTRVQGVIINAGGIVAYYPSKFPLHYRPKALGSRDLFGELAAAAHADGLVVFARMDSNRAHEEFFKAHPDWFARQQNGEPYRAGEHYVTCINSPYYEAYLPDVLREIIERSQPEGITDNSWAGLGRGSICYCENCQKRFQRLSGEPIPREKNWDSPFYRRWIEWNYARRIELWELNNQTTKAAGGPHCIWSGMNSGSITGQSSSFRDYREICRRAEIIMLDHQTRGESSGFQENALVGQLIHGLLGWDKLVPESMAMYQAGRPTFRLSSKPALEARLWMVEGMAGGIQPWWHHVGAYHEDRRMYSTAEPLMAWHEQNQPYLVNRRPMANIGLVWCQRNTDFYGRDDAEELVERPWHGWANALTEARIPFLPIHLDDLDRDKPRVIILPNLAALSDEQLARIRRFVENGGHLIATGETSRCDENGGARPDFGLADLLGVHVISGQPASLSEAKRRAASATIHSYLRLRPELRARVNGPRAGNEPRAAGARHPLLAGFEDTDILPFGGTLEPLRVDESSSVLATFVPAFPIYPPETAWMREPRTEIPALLARSLPNGARVIYMPADIDRRYARDHLPDQRRLLENAVRWAANDLFPFTVSGPGFLDCHLYSQGERLILHVVNLTSPGAWRAPADEIISVGPLGVSVQRAGQGRPRKVRFLVAGGQDRLREKAGHVAFKITQLGMHEVAVLTN